MKASSACVYSRERRIAGLLLFCVIAFAGAGASSAQGFPMFGKGIEIWGLVDDIVREGPGGRSTSTEAIVVRFRVQGGVLVVDNVQQCSLNGAPTNIGLVFVRHGAYARSFTCDTERKGTASQGSEGTTSQSIRTTASVTGNVVTLNFSNTAVTKGWEISPNTGRLEGAAKVDVKGMVSIRFHGQTCTVLAASQEQVAVSDLRTASGAPYRKREVRHRAISPFTGATCSFLPD